MKNFDYYSKSGKYDDVQLEEISKAFERGLDVERFVKPCYNAEQLRELRKLAEEGIYMYIDPSIDYRCFSIIGGTKNELLRYQLIDFSKEGFDYKQLEKIRERSYRLESVYDNRLSPDQMIEIVLGLNYDLDVSVYKDPSYSAEKMRLIRLALVEGLDVSSFTKTSLSYDEMVLLRDKARELKLKNWKPSEEQ